MSEKPIIITRNACVALSGYGAGDTPASGFDGAYCIDNLDYTSYRPQSTGAFIIYFILNTLDIDCCVIKFRGQGTFYTELKDSDSTLIGSKSSMTQGVIYIPITVTPTTYRIRCEFDASYSDFELVHFWAGKAYTIKDPIQPFDPNQVLIGQEKFENNNGINIKNSVRFRKKILQATWTNVSGSVKTNFEYLREHSFKNGTPFWFFMRPTTSPTDGDIYHFDMEEFKLDYNVGIQRTVSIKAIAEYVIEPENTPIAQPTSLTNTSGATIQWTHAVPQPDGYIVLSKTGSSPSDVPVVGTAYYIGQTIGTSVVSYIGTSNSFTETNAVGARYYDVFSVNGIETGDYKYLTTSPLEGNFTFS